MSGTYSEIDTTSEHEPEEVERFAMSKEDEEKFLEWGKRLVPSIPMEPF